MGYPNVQTRQATQEEGPTPNNRSEQSRGSGGCPPTATRRNEVNFTWLNKKKIEFLNNLLDELF